jgi:hypothetical protein
VVRDAGLGWEIRRRDEKRKERRKVRREMRWRRAQQRKDEELAE